jgi:hypothetical protein
MVNLWIDLALGLATIIVLSLAFSWVIEKFADFIGYTEGDDDEG